MTLTTAPSPGAVAIVQVTGADTRELLERVVKPIHPRKPAHGHARTSGRTHLINLADIDRGLLVFLRDDWAQLMPHGGPRVVEKLIDTLLAAGAVYQPAPVNARELYPEATSALEADMLMTLSRAASPAAIDLLLAQPRLWRAFRTPDPTQRPTLSGGWDDITSRTRILDRLIEPAAVVVVGRPNVGKSTLANRMLGRGASLVADLPGTTRDWVAGLAELSTHTSGGSRGGVAVRWLDTPGLRDSNDLIEQQAIASARQVITSADVVIAMRDPGTDWPAPEDLTRQPDLRLINKSDRATPPDDVDLHISALAGTNLDQVERHVLEALNLHDLTETPWAFSPMLKRLLHVGDLTGLQTYLGVDSTNRRAG